MSDLVCRINRRDGFTVQTSWFFMEPEPAKTETLRITEADVRPRITRKELWYFLVGLLGIGVVGMLALYGFAKLLVLIARSFGL